MKIIFVLRSVVLSGGLERVMTEKANWLAHNGHQVLFLTYEQGNHNLSFPLDSSVIYEDLECRYFTVYNKNIVIRPIYKLLMKKQFRLKLKSKICSYRPDVMIVPHNIDEFLGPVTMMNVLVPIVFESHSTHVEILKSVYKRNIFFGKFLFLSCVKRCSLVISLTEGDAIFWRHFCDHVTSVPNPLSFYPEINNVSYKDSCKIVCVARLHEVKRIDRLVEAFALISNKYPRWHIDIYGEGEKKDELLKMISDKKLQSKIRIYPPTIDIYRKYMESEFIVLSSDSESFSLVLVEAMSCGIPAVSVACPFGPSEIIEDHVTGLLTKLDEKDLADKMEWMITHEEERIKMGICARESALRFKKDVVMKQWEKAYLSVSK